MNLELEEIARRPLHRFKKASTNILTVRCDNLTSKQLPKKNSLFDRIRHSQAVSKSRQRSAEYSPYYPSVLPLIAKQSYIQKLKQAQKRHQLNEFKGPLQFESSRRPGSKIRVVPSEYFTIEQGKTQNLVNSRKPYSSTESGKRRNYASASASKRRHYIQASKLHTNSAQSSRQHLVQGQYSINSQQPNKIHRKSKFGDKDNRLNSKMQTRGSKLGRTRIISIQNQNCLLELPDSRLKPVGSKLVNIKKFNLPSLRNSEQKSEEQDVDIMDCMNRNTNSLQDMVRVRLALMEYQHLYTQDKHDQ